MNSSNEKSKFAYYCGSQKCMQDAGMKTSNSTIAMKNIPETAVRFGHPKDCPDCGSAMIFRRKFQHALTAKKGTEP